MKAEKWKERRVRDAILERARKVLSWKVDEFEAKKEARKKELGLEGSKSSWTAEARADWNAWLLKERTALNNWLLENVAEAEKNLLKDAAIKAESRRVKRAAIEEKKEAIRAIYGFTLGKKPVTAEEIEGRRRYERDMDAERRQKDREKIRIYNREYRRGKRAEALAKEQEKWSSAQWAAFEKKMDAKRYPKGSPQWLVREAVRHLSRTQGVSEDVVTERLIETGGMDFLVKGAESLGQDRCATAGGFLAAIRALAFFIDPEQAVLFGQNES